MPSCQKILLILVFALAAVAHAGTEDFANFPVSGSTYTDGNFTGRDGSTWSFIQCRGDKLIAAPTPGMHKGKTPPASLTSGTLTGGCGTLSFDYMRMFTSTVKVDVVINGTVRYTVTGTDTQNFVASTGPITINQGGNFTLKLEQNNFNAGQAAIDNIAWTTYGGSDPEPPEILFSPDITNKVGAYSNLVQLTVTATEPNEDTVRLWASGLPSGATFNAATGTTPLISAFSWTPTDAQTGAYSVVFYAGDKDGTNSRAFAIEVTPIYPYYHYAEGLTGAVLKAKLHEIISTGAVQLDDTGEDAAMRELNTDPANTNNVIPLYNPTSSIPKSAYNTPSGWNKEHCWPESRGLGNDGPDQVDVHNLYAEHTGVNALRGNLYFDESDPADPGYRNPATNAAPETSMDSDSWEPPPASKGNVARALFYMAVRYDGTEPDTSALSFSDNPSHTNTMGILTNLLLWHVMDPPDDAERNRNELIYSKYQHNRNPFIDRPEWVEEIWGTDDDNDGVTATHEIIAGSDPNNSNSVFRATLSGTGTSIQVGCGLLATGSVWQLYRGDYVGNHIVWAQTAATNRLQTGQLRFDVAPTSTAAFYHLRAARP